MDQDESRGGRKVEATRTGDFQTSKSYLSFVSYKIKLQVCSALREELEEEHRKRMEAVNSKFKPLTITDEPSRKV